MIRYIPFLKKYISYNLLIISLLIISGKVNGATITTSGSGNWNSTTINAPWPGGVVPSAGDNVIIAAGHTVTVSSNTSITDLNLNSPTSTLIINSGQTITVSGLFLNSGTTVNGVNGPGTLQFTGTTSFGTLTASGVRPNILIGNGIISNTVTINAATLIADLTIQANATLGNTSSTVGISGNLTVNGSLNAGTGVYTLSELDKIISGVLSIPSLAIKGTYSNTITSTIGTAISCSAPLIKNIGSQLNI